MITWSCLVLVLPLCLGAWDDMSRWAAGRYQLLVLSCHYQESSQQLVGYLSNMEKKISQSGEDIPECIVEKIKAQSAKAKVFYFRSFIFHLSSLSYYFNVSLMYLDFQISNFRNFFVKHPGVFCLS